MKILKFNIAKPKKYTDKQGNEKTQWNNIGIMTEFQKDDGSVSRIIEIPAIGLDANIFPLEDKKQENQPKAPQQGRVRTDVEYPEEEIDPESIPF